jgi:ribosomal protein S18 acetylase RimI-like enzyme
MGRLVIFHAGSVFVGAQCHIWVDDSLAADGAERRQFLGLPRAVYGSRASFCVPRDGDVLADVHRDCFQGRQRVFLALQGGSGVARVVARVSPVLQGPADSPLGMLGFFEALDRPDEVVEMLRAALAWARAQGVQRVVGPLDGDTWHRYRLNTGPHDDPPFLGEPHNPAYYPGLWEQAGFEPMEGYYTKRLDDVSVVLPRFEPILRRVVANGYRLRPIDLQRFDEELRILFDLSRKVFRDNFLYDDISFREFHRLYAPTRPLLDADLVTLARAPDGHYAGFLFAYADLYRAVGAMRGSRGPLAKLRFWWNRRQADTVNLKSLGVLPGYRRSGLGTALVCQAYQHMLAKRFRRANLCLIRDDNPSGRLDGGHGRILRRYVLYQYRWTKNLSENLVTARNDRPTTRLSERRCEAYR